MDSPVLHEFKRQASFFHKENQDCSTRAYRCYSYSAVVEFDRRNWRPSYKAVMLLEYLLTHGPESIAEEFQSDEDVIRQMECFQYVDEKGFNWGSSVRNMSERVTKLLQHGSFLKKERERTVGIKGFGSFCKRPVSSKESMKEAISERYLEKQFWLY